MADIEITHDRDVVTVTLNRPDVRNALSPDLARALRAAFTGLDARAVVLQGAGKSFCAGADIDSMRRSRELSEDRNREQAEELAAAFRAVDDCPCPVVARAQGAALGGGAGLLAVCDVVVAADDLRIAFTEVRLGIVPAIISPFVVRKIGASAARRYFVTAENMPPAEARRLGLVHEVVPASELDAKVGEIVGHLRAAGAEAMRHAKRLARTVGELPLSLGIAEGARTIARARASEEGQEGLSAFLEKRSPSWVKP